MPDINKLISGFRVFKATTFQKQKDTIQHLLAQGQKPSTMVIACSDIRISPSDIFGTNPGELYILNNVGGLVPKYDAGGVHGIMAAIEYAVKELEVENVVVLGHAKCDAIKMMMSNKYSANIHGLSEPMKTWLSIASEAREAVKTQLSTKTPQEQQDACEHESIIVSMRNLITYPYIAERMVKKKLTIHGWHFDVETGDIMAFNPQTGYFDLVS